MRRIIEEPIPIQTKDGRVAGYLLENEKIRVNAGSFFRNRETNTLLPGYRRTRAYLINNHYIQNDQFIKPYEFDNACEAFCCCYGRRENGIKFFFTNDNIALDEYLELDPIAAFEQKKEVYGRTKFLVCNVTWMEKYQGIEPVFATNWSFVSQNGFGYELLNFYDDNGFLYGYTEMHEGSITLSRIDKDCSDDHIDGVTVIWISKNPKGKLTIVGFYRNATVYSKRQTRSNNQRYPWYFIKAKTSDSYLIPCEDRDFEFPTTRANRPGQASVWYGANEELKAQMLDYINKIDSQRQHYKKTRKIVENDDEYGVVSTNDIDKEIYSEPDYSPVKVSEKVVGTTSSYKRNEARAKKAIVNSNFTCNLDASHKSFISKNGKPYMEAHHLIPINAQGDFKTGLDCEANIVSLCPTCHRMLHYGEDIKEPLKKLYNERKEKLEQAGIKISFEDLMKYYKD